jgi:hypothetical protein
VPAAHHVQLELLHCRSKPPLPSCHDREPFLEAVANVTAHLVLPHCQHAARHPADGEAPRCQPSLHNLSLPSVDALPRGDVDQQGFQIGCNAKFLHLLPEIHS